MYTRRNIRWNMIFQMAWQKIVVFAAWSSAVTFAYLQFASIGLDISIPLAPLGTIGVAVAFYVGFKNNQAYERYWEARKIWGGIVNTSRSFANQVLAFISAHHCPDPVEPAVIKGVQQRMIYRHLAWMHSLRYQLRRKTLWGFTPKGGAARFSQTTDIEALRKQVSDLLPNEELKVVCPQANAATQILRMQSDDLRRIVDEQKLTEDFRLIALMEQITEMYALQGKCERIKNTPFPRQYAYFSGVFVWIFIAMLPFAIVPEFAQRSSLMIWLTVPLSVVISWIFYTMEAVGDSSEDPFENFVNDVPLTALCRTIEIDLRQMMGETDVPEPIKPEYDILM
ncbi:MAG: putative membrane protein [Mariniblastus sp.]|jgi:putative membrane protein